MSFEAARASHGGIAVLTLRGEMDAGADEALSAAYAAVSEDVIVLNFSAVSYINSTGIALIVGVLADARGAGRKVLACGLTEHYKEIFEITRLSDFVTMFDDQEQALAAGRA